jgi:hypothetical protein
MFQAVRKFVTAYFGAKPARNGVPDGADGRVIRARYDAAQTTDEYKNAWANTDRFDADSAHSKEVRHMLIARSRYEIGKQRLRGRHRSDLRQ